MVKSSIISGQLDIYSQTYPGQMYPPVETSGGQDWYYIRSASWSDIPSSDVPLVEASGGQDWYYIRSASWSDIPSSDVTPSRAITVSGAVPHQVSFTLFHLVFSYWRGKSNIAMQDILVLFVVVVVVLFCFCCCSSVIVEADLQLNNNYNNKITQ